MRAQRMRAQKAQIDVRACGNKFSATRQISPNRPFEVTEIGRFQTVHSLRTDSTIETRDIADILEYWKASRITCADHVVELIAIEDGPWAVWKGANRSRRDGSQGF